MNNELVVVINEQINKEFYSAYLYLSMSQYFEGIDMNGMAKWMYEQFREEQYHAQKFIKYLNARGESVELETIEKPKTNWNSIIGVFEDTLSHEKDITDSINSLTGIAVDKKDFATVNYLQWYINEQVEEEETVSGIINQLKLIGDNGYGLLMLDKELSTRNFIEPVGK